MSSPTNGHGSTASPPSSSRSSPAGPRPPSSGGLERPRRREPPVSAAVLGVVGLLPFAAAAGVYAWGPADLRGPALLTLLAWSAANLAFLGGVRWGVEMAARREPRWTVLTLSMAPPAAGLLILAAAPLAATERQLGGFLVAFALQWLWDGRAEDPPAWYARLRFWLTLGGVAGLAAALHATVAL